MTFIVMEARVRAESKEPQSARVTKSLRAAIMAGEFRLGQKLTEAELAARYQTNHRVIREALGELAGQGLIVRDAYRGNSIFHPSMKEIEGLRLTRTALEALAASIAAYRIRPVHITRLRERITVPDGGFTAYHDMAHWDLNIHSLIWEIADEPGLTDQLNHLIMRCIACNAELPANQEVFEMERTQDVRHPSSHVPVVEAICSGDSESARHAMIRHLTHCSPNKEFEHLVEAGFGPVRWTGTNALHTK